MADANIILPTEPTQRFPVVRSIGLVNLRDALVKGLDDFRAMPTHVVFLSLIYPVVGIALGSATFGYDLVPLLFPLIAGFALIGPLTHAELRPVLQRNAGSGRLRFAARVTYML
jgi:uncharacterized membrane protein